MHLALEAFHVAIGPGEDQGAAEPGVAIGEGLGQRGDLGHGHGIVAAAAGQLRPVRRAHPGIAAERGDGEAAVVGERGQAGGPGGGERLDAGIAEEAVLGLGRLRQAEGADRGDLHAIGGEQGGDLAQLAGIVGGQHEPAGGEPAMRHQPRPTAARCWRNSASVPLRARREQFEHLRLGEGLRLGGGLHLDDAAAAGEDEIGVGLRLAVLGIVEVEHGGALPEAAGDGGDLVAQRHGLQDVHRHAVAEGQVQRHPGAGDAGAAGAAVGGQHVAVDGDGHLAHGLQVGDGAQGPADQPLDFQGAAGLLAAGGLAVAAGMGGAGQHAVFGGDPARAGAAQEGRHPALDRGGAEHLGIAHADAAGALRVPRHAGLEQDAAKGIGGAARGAGQGASQGAGQGVVGRGAGHAALGIMAGPGEARGHGRAASH